MIKTCIESDEVDIMLFAEGTFPFVRGGVSAWIHTLIENLPQYRFGVIFLGAYEGLYPKYQYPIPKNLVHLQILYLFSNEQTHDTGWQEPKNPKVMENIASVHQLFKDSVSADNGLSGAPPDLSALMSEKEGIGFCEFLRSEASWQFITDQYMTHSTTASFVDYFWNIRNMHEPLWRLAQFSTSKLPKLNILHSISTGYAGFLASMIKQRLDCPLLLSEHGLYTKERHFELIKSSMFPKDDPLLANKKIFNYHHKLWLNFFEALGRTTYYYANLITSLYIGAQKQQQAYGAPADKTRVVPNGINIEHFASVRRPVAAKIPKIICFVGRVVPIKDVKTYIRTVANVVASDNSITAWIKPVGNEEPEYEKECRDYIEFLGLEDKVIFKKEGGMLEMLKDIGVLMLTSISEGMPLVVLEAMAAGIPVVSTDVGSCREILEGGSKEDKALGVCGFVAPVLDATALAREVVKLLNNEKLWRECRDTAIHRVERYYSLQGMIDNFDSTYNKLGKDGRHRN